MVLVILLVLIITIMIIHLNMYNELIENRKLLNTYTVKEKHINDIVNADVLIDKIKEHFRNFRMIKDIPFIASWIKESNGTVIDMNTTMQDIMMKLKPEEIQMFADVCKISDKYTLSSYNIDGTRRPVVFYEVLAIPGCELRGVWKTIKWCVPADENDDKKVIIMTQAIMHEKLHGSFEKALERLKILEKNNLVIKIHDNIYINKSKGDY